MLTINKMYDPEIGGVETVAKQIQSLVDNSKVLTFQNNTSKKTEHTTIDNVNVTRLKTNYVKNSIRLSFEYSKYFKNMIDDINIFHFPSGQPELYYNLIDENKHNICFYHQDVVNKGAIGYVYNKLIISKFLKKMEWIIVTSENMKNSSSILQPFKDKVLVVPLFVDTDHFNIMPVVPRDKNNILFVGRLSKYKGLSYLIDQLFLLPKAYDLTIVGQGNLKTSLIQQQKDLDVIDRVHFINHVSYNDLPKYYNNQSVLVLPSISRAEAFGLVGLEQLACGIPIVTTELGTGTTCYNKPGITGQIAKPRSETELQMQIYRVIQENDKYNRSQLRQYVDENFSSKIFNNNMLNILNNLK